MIFLLILILKYKVIAKIINWYYSKFYILNAAIIDKFIEFIDLKVMYTEIN